MDFFLLYLIYILFLKKNVQIYILMFQEKIQYYVYDYIQIFVPIHVFDLFIVIIIIVITFIKN